MSKEGLRSLLRGLFCVFDRGKVVQQSDHETLVADADGLYHQLWQAQYYH